MWKAGVIAIRTPVGSMSAPDLSGAAPSRFGTAGAFDLASDRLRRHDSFSVWALANKGPYANVDRARTDRAPMAHGPSLLEEKSGLGPSDLLSQGSKLGIELLCGGGDVLVVEPAHQS